jgi:hypothetical protein
VPVERIQLRRSEIFADESFIGFWSSVATTFSNISFGFAQKLEKSTTNAERPLSSVAIKDKPRID